MFTSIETNVLYFAIEVKRRQSLRSEKLQRFDGKTTEFSSLKIIVSHCPTLAVHYSAILYKIFGRNERVYVSRPNKERVSVTERNAAGK